MQLVYSDKPIGKRTSKPWIVTDMGPFYRAGKSLRKFVEEASALLDGKPGYLVFNKDEEVGNFGIVMSLGTILSGISPVDLIDVLPELLNQTICDNSRHRNSPRVDALANFFTITEESMKQKGFYDDKNGGVPLSFWINVPAP